MPGAGELRIKLGNITKGTARGASLKEAIGSLTHCQDEVVKAKQPVKNKPGKRK